MLAYTLQMLFFALSIFSVVIMFVMLLNDMKATKKQWWTLLLPILLLFMAVAYRFDWTTNTTSDLYRFFKDFDALSSVGWSYEMKYADNFAWLWKVIAYAFSRVENLHWFPVFATAVDMGIFFYILIEVAIEKDLSAFDVLVCILLRLSLMPIIMSISATRNTMAYSLFSLGVYMYYKHGLKNAGVYLWMLAGVLTHTTVLLGVIVFVVSLLVRRWKPLLVFLVLMGIFYGGVIGPMLENSTNEYIQYFVGKWEMYSVIPNKYDVQKTNFIIVGLLPLFVLFTWWYFSNIKSPNKNKMCYILSNIAVTLGVSVIMPTLFLRLCYPTATIIPTIWGEIKTTEWRRKSNGIIYWLMIIICALVLFVSTRLAWFHELYWFFEI